MGFANKGKLTVGKKNNVIETFCGECGCRITISPTGIEYGHKRMGDNGFEDMCSRRPESVEPKKPWARSNHD